MLGLGCGTTNPHRESLTEYYWEVQNLRMQSGPTEQGAVALRDLGSIYLRTGYYTEAYDVLSRSLAQDRSDPKRWLLAGVSLELLGRTDAALSTYERILSLSAASPYTRAIRGREAWLSEARRRRDFESAVARADTLQFANAAPNRYAVFPIDCVTDNPAYDALGKGFADMISGDMESLRNVDMVDPHQVRIAYEAAGATSEERLGFARTVWTGRMLGAGRLVGGSCTIGNDETVEVDLVLRNLTTGDVKYVSGQDRLQNIAALEQSLIRSLATELNIWIPNREGANVAAEIPLDAILAYSHGIMSADEGDLQSAYEAFTESLGLYPRFLLASNQLARAENMLMTEVSDNMDLVDLVVGLEATEMNRLALDAGIQALGSGLGATFLPGQDVRKLPPGSIGELPTPPVPQRN